MTTPYTSGRLARTPPSTKRATQWDEHGTMLKITACVAILIAVCGFLGNLLTIIALTSKRGPSAKLRRNASNLFIVSLSLADLMFSTINMPFAASRFIHQAWIHGEFLCKLFPFLRYMNVGLSLLSITAIAINRYILIGHRRLYDRIYRHQIIYLMIGITWIFPVVVLIPTWFERWGKFGYDEKIINCSILKDAGGKSPKYFLFVASFLIPCFTIVICYARIFWIVHRSKIKMSSHARTPELTKSREMKRKQEEWRVTKMVLIIFCSFLVCYLPITVVKVADRDISYPSYQLLAYTLVYMSACINPIIYGITNQQYREAYKYTLSWLLSGFCPEIGQPKDYCCCNPRGSQGEQCDNDEVDVQTKPTQLTSVAVQCPSCENLEQLGSADGDCGENEIMLENDPDAASHSKL